LVTLWSIGHPWNALCHFSFLILRQWVGLLGWWISPSQGRYRYKLRINTYIHTLSEIRTDDPSVRACEDSSCFRPRGHRDRQSGIRGRKSENRNMTDIASFELKVRVCMSWSFGALS
jgi:hypothetical protein